MYQPCRCLRCGHKWIPRVEDPKRCPNCGSTRWDKYRISEIKERSLEEMKGLQDSSDTEVAHRKADDILCDVLVSQGFKELVDEFDKLRKWYA